MNSLLYSIKKMLGMSSLLLAMMAVFTPIVTIYLIWASIFMAGFAGLTGSLVFSAIAILVNVFNLVFFSPVSLALVGGNFFSMIITAVIFIISLGAWFFGLKLKIAGSMEKAEQPASSRQEPVRD